MKSHTLLLLLVATLSCRAENSTASAADRPAQKVDAAKPAQVAETVSAPTKATDVAVQAKPVDETAQKTVAQNSESLSLMAPVVVTGSSDLKPALNLKKDLAATLAETKAAMTLQLANDAKNQKAALTGMLMGEQPMLFAPKLANVTAPAVAAAPAGENKNLVVDASRSK